jgi:hypothetical protein
LEGTGYLIFENTNLNAERVKVDWELTLGQTFSGSKSWKALITFPGHSPNVPSWILNLISVSLSDSRVKIYLHTEDEEEVEGHISDIQDLADCGVIELSSLNLPRTRMYTKYA